MSLRTKRWLRGLMRSWTANTAVVIAVLGYLQTQHQLIDRHLGEDATGITMMVIGVLMVALRAKTTTSLETKGMK